MAVPDRTFDALYGLEIVSEDVVGAGMIRGAVPVRADILNHHGTVHGGVYAAAAEALASFGTAVVVMPGGNVAVGLSNDTTVLADVTAGALRLEAIARDRADAEWVWTVEARDDDDRLCALSRVTVAVRRRPASL